MKLIEGDRETLQSNVSYIRAQRLNQIQRHEGEIRKRIEDFMRNESVEKDSMIPAKELNRSYKELPKEVISAITGLIHRLETFYGDSRDTSWELSAEHGIHYKQKIVPFKRIGVYIPDTPQAVLTLIHLVVPARIAGVKDVAVSSPLAAHGRKNALFAYTCKTLGIKELFKWHGVEALSYFCFGNPLVRPVDKIFATGGIDLQCAKRYLLGRVGLDPFLGASEVSYLINDTCDESALSSAIIEQFRFDPDSLVTIFSLSSRKSSNLINTFIEVTSGSEELDSHLQKVCSHSTFLFSVKNVSESIQLINAMCPAIVYLYCDIDNEKKEELTHPALVVSPGEDVLSKVGFLIGPCFLGPSLGTARFSSTLKPSDFYKSVEYLDIQPEETGNLRKISEVLSAALSTGL